MAGIVPETLSASTTNGNGSTKARLPSSPDWNKLVSSRAKLWQPAAIRGLLPLEKTPNMISLLAGKPNPSTFPFSSFSFTLSHPSTFSPFSSSDEATTLSLTGPELIEALQYGPTNGLTRLHSWLVDLQEKVHNRPREEQGGKKTWGVSVGSGSQDVMCKAFQCLVEEGDTVLVETPAYPGTLGMLKPEKVNLLEIPCDSSGLSPSSLISSLHSLSNQSTLRSPKLLYTIPTGSNPSGLSAPTSRKRDVLKIVYEHDLILLEDDAYWFLYFGDEKAEEGEEGRKSYFELEREMFPEVVKQGGGRVVRFDSFSKILSSGMRLGFITAPPALLHYIDLQTANTNLQPSSLAQSVAQKLLVDHWGLSGFIEHVRTVKDFYRMRRDEVEGVAKEVLQDGEKEGWTAEWVSPRAGMFLWLKLRLGDAEGKAGEGEGDSNELIRERAIKKGFLAVPGVAFYPTTKTSPYVRISFSEIDKERAREAFVLTRPKVIDYLMQKFNQDLVFCRAPDDNDLTSVVHERQVEKIDPLLDWVKSEFGFKPVVYSSFFGGKQEDGLTKAIETVLKQTDDCELAAIDAIASSAHSLIIAIGIHWGKLQTEEAIELIRLEEDLQVDRWGLVEGGHDVDLADLKVQIASAAVFLGLSRRI